MVKRFVISCMFLVLFSISANAESSEQYAIKGKKAWSAFSCSALAEMAGKQDEQERLFLLGYDEGKAFLNALRMNKIEQDDLNETVPMFMLMLLQGPSNDFMLGRVFEFAVDEATKNAYQVYKETSNEVLKKSTAETDFTSRNCSLLE